jgi:hypothetical protein
MFSKFLLYLFSQDPFKSSSEVRIVFWKKNVSDGIVKTKQLQCFVLLTTSFCSHTYVNIAHPVSYPVGTGVHPSGVKWPGRDADHSPPSARVKNTCTIPPLCHTCAWFDAWLVTRNNFTSF